MNPNYIIYILRICEQCPVRRTESASPMGKEVSLLHNVVLTGMGRSTAAGLCHMGGIAFIMMGGGGVGGGGTALAVLSSAESSIAIVLKEVGNEK